MFWLRSVSEPLQFCSWPNESQIKIVSIVLFIFLQYNQTRKYNPQTRLKNGKTQTHRQKFGKPREPANIKLIKQHEYKSIRLSKSILCAIKKLTIFVHVYNCVIHFITALSSKNWEPVWRLKPENILITIPETRAKKMGKPVTRLISKTWKPDGKNWQNPWPVWFPKPENPMAKIGKTRNPWNPKAPSLRWEQSLK